MVIIDRRGGVVPAVTGQQSGSLTGVRAAQTETSRQMSVASPIDDAKGCGFDSSQRADGLLTPHSSAILWFRATDEL